MFSSGIRIFFLMAAVLLSVPSPGWSEMLTGTVVSVDQKNREVVLDIGEDQDSRRKVVIQAPDDLPACALVGAQMRAWGSFAAGEATKFSATDLRGPGRRTDATGVLSRLHNRHPRSSRHLSRKNSSRPRLRRRRHR